MAPLKGIPAGWLHPAGLQGLVGSSVCGVQVIFAVGWVQGMACCQMKAGVWVQ